MGRGGKSMPATFETLVDGERYGGGWQRAYAFWGIFDRLPPSTAPHP